MNFLTPSSNKVTSFNPVNPNKNIHCLLTSHSDMSLWGALIQTSTLRLGSISWNPGVDLMSNQIFVGYSHKFFTTIELACLVGKLSLQITGFLVHICIIR